MKSAMYSTALTPLNLPTHHKGGGGGFKAVLGIAAMAIIPMVAPAIAASLAGSSMLAGTAFGGFLATAGGSALVGATLGGITGAAMGGGFKGAALGAIGGGIGGYMNAPTSSINAAPATAGGYTGGVPTSVTTGAAPGAGLVGYTPDPSLMASTSALDSIGAVNAGSSFTNLSQAGFTGGPQAATGGLSAQLSNAAPAATGYVGAGGTPVAQVTGAQMPTGGYSAAGQVSAPTSFVDNLGKAAGNIYDTVTDPKKLATVGMQLGVNQLSSMMVPTPEMTAEEKALLSQQQQSLANMDAREAQAFDAKMQGAQNMMGYAQQYVNPEEFAREQASKAKVSTARATQAGLRGINPSDTGAADTAARRGALNSALAGATAYDQGMGTGIGAFTQQYAAGVNAIPSAPKEYNSALNSYGTQQASMYNRLEESRRRAAQMFGGLTPEPMPMS